MKEFRLGVRLERQHSWIDKTERTQARSGGEAGREGRHGDGAGKADLWGGMLRYAPRLLFGRRNGWDGGEGGQEKDEK